MGRSGRVYGAVLAAVILAGGATLLVGMNARGESAAFGTWSRPSTSVSGTPLPSGSKSIATANQPGSALSVDTIAPYLYLGWGDPPDPVTLMKQTGLTRFTLAFIISDGKTCAPLWDGERPLTGGDDQNEIARIRAAGGDVVPSIGGSGGVKLGQVCQTARALANAYEKVIDTYKLNAYDLDLEADEFRLPAATQRIIDAVGIVKRERPNVAVYITVPSADGTQAIQVPLESFLGKAAKAHLEVDVWMQMAFDLSESLPLTQTAIHSSEWMVNWMAKTFGYSMETAYKHLGLVTMNGLTDVQGERITVADMLTLINYVKQHRMSRFSFWSVNRDRPCAGTRDDSCSGLTTQSAWQYSKAAIQAVSSP